jgi:cell division septal protein FtsQ
VDRATEREGRVNRRPARPRARIRPRELSILRTTTAPKPSNKQIAHMAVWCALVLAMIVAVGTGLHFGIAFVLDHVLYNNPRYALHKIEIEPRDRFGERLVRQAAGLEPGQNLWALNLHKIARELEQLPNVSKASVERHFPDKLTIKITERVPVVRIDGINIDIGTRDHFYLDRQCVVLKPRGDELQPQLPEVIGLSDAELEPGKPLDCTSLSRAMDILDGIEHSELHTMIDIARIDLSDPLSIRMETRQSTIITFRPDCIDQQLQRLLTIVNYPDFQLRQIHTVDLTPDRNVPVTFCQIQPQPTPPQN